MWNSTYWSTVAWGTARWGTEFWGVSGAISIEYDLKALFTADNQTFTNGQVLDTAAEGVEDGSLTVVDTSTGTVKIVDNELEIIGSSGWNTSGIVTTNAVTKQLGLGIFDTAQNDTTSGLDIFHITDGTTLLNIIKYAWLKPQNGILQVTFKGGSNIVLGTLTVKTSAMQYLFLCGGYDSNGIAFKTGDTPGDFLYGFRILAKGDVFVNWTLLWADPNGNDSSLYYQVQNYYAAKKTTHDNILIPTEVLDVDTMFQPNFLDTFTGTNGNPLVGYHRPEVVGGVDPVTDVALVQPDPGLEASIWDADAAVFTSGTYSWVAEGTNTISNDSNTLKIVYNDNAAGAKVLLNDSKDLSSNLSIGVIYKIGHDCKINTGDVRLAYWDGVSATIANSITSTSFDTYSVFICSKHVTNCSIKNNGLSAGEEFWFDNMSLQEVTLNELFATDDLSITEGIFDVDLTIPAATDGMAGLVLALDSESSPANFIQAYYNRGTGKVEVWKCVAGSYTSLINTTASYSAGATLRAGLKYISATDDLELTVYYNGSIVGTKQTIEDNGIAGNTRHGIMNTSSNNTVENFNYSPWLWESGADTWEIQSNAAVNDPGLEASIWDADAAVFTSGTYSWEAQGGNTLANVSNTLEVTYVDNTVGALCYFKNASDLSSDLTVGKIYKFTSDTKVSSGTTRWAVYDGVSTVVIKSVSNTNFESTMSWLSAKSATGAYCYNYQFDPGAVFGIDNLSIQEITLDELFASDDLLIEEGLFDVNVTIPAITDGVAGLVLCLDDKDSPANFIQIYYNRPLSKIEAWKCVAGSYTNLINTTATYSAGAQLRAILDYDSTEDELKLKVYYNGALIDSEQTIDNAGIAGNTRHGIMSTSTEAACGMLAVTKRTDANWDTEIASATGEIY